MKAKLNAPKRFRVKEGDLSILISPWRGIWRFRWRKDKLDRPKWVTKPAKDEAKAAAEEKLREIAAGEVEWSALSERRKAFLREIHRETREEDQAAILAFIASRKKSATVSVAVQQFLEYKAGGKAEKPHLKQVRRDLEDLAEKFPGALVSDITEDRLRTWWKTRYGKAGDDRKKGLRGTLVMFWLWAQSKGYAGSEPTTIAQQLTPVAATKGKLEIFHLPEIEFLLSIVAREWFPLIVLGAFEGIRPEEIAPKKDNPKEALRWEHIDWDWNVVRIPDEVAKTGRGRVPRGRIVPLHPVARAWLEAFGAEPTWTGRICEENPSEAYRKDDPHKPSRRPTQAWGEALQAKFPARFQKWPKDALRHSYASYRIAILQVLETVALEMGNSDDMLHGHYNNPRTRPQGEAWFDFFPEKANVRAPYLKVSGGIPISTTKSAG